MTAENDIVITTVRVPSYMASIRPVVHAYLMGQVTRNEFFARCLLIRDIT